MERLNDCSRFRDRRQRDLPCCSDTSGSARQRSAWNADKQVCLTAVSQNGMSHRCNRIPERRQRGLLCCSATVWDGLSIAAEPMKADASLFATSALAVAKLQTCDFKPRELANTAGHLRRLARQMRSCSPWALAQKRSCGRRLQATGDRQHSMGICDV